ncbi:MAG: cytochrome P450 [Nannocystaceae bacterium]
MAPGRPPPRLAGSRVAVTRAFLRDPLGFSCEVAAAHPTIVEVPILYTDYLFVSDPHLVDEILVKHAQEITKDRFTWRLREFLGHGLLTSEGAHWKRQRRLIQPTFHRKRVAGYGEIMVSEAEATIAGWRGGEVRDVHHDLMGLTLGIAGRTFFGRDVGGGAAAVGEAVERVMDRYAGDFWEWALPLWVPTRANRRTVAAVRRVDGILEAIIADRRRSGADTGDLLSLLLHAQDEDGGRMSDRQIRDECITLFLAGHETTALALTYALYLLAGHPEVGARVRDEAQAAAPGRPLGVDDLPRLRAAEQVIKESMRLYPPAWSIGRELLAPFEVGGHTLRRGAQVGIFTWALHRDPGRFPEPLAFRPERWTEAFERSLPKQGYMPFGGGQRICIGNTFAMVEATLLLSTILRRFSFERTSTTSLRLRPSITLRPRGGVHLRVHEHAASTVA